MRILFSFISGAVLLLPLSASFYNTQTHRARVLLHVYLFTQNAGATEMALNKNKSNELESDLFK